MTVEEICQNLKRDEGVDYILSIGKDRNGYLITETNEYGMNFLSDPFYFVDNNGVLILTGYGAFDYIDSDTYEELEIPKEFRPTKKRK